MSIHLTEQDEARIRAKVETGRYHDAKAARGSGDAQSA